MLRVEDRFFQMQGGTIIVREGVERLPWLVTFLPDDQDSAYYPGFTISSADSEVPHGPTFEVVAAWAFKQPWVSSWETPEAVHTPPPEGAESLDVPADEWADLQHTAFEHNVRVGFTKEPDGSFSFGVYSPDGELLQHGLADTWDDARLAMVEDLYPPSDEPRQK